MMHRIAIVDSHTAGEPTRVVVDGGPDLGSGTLAEKREVFATRFDHFRSAIVNEPRGSDVIVGALLIPPADPAAVAGVIFFNNVGYLSMCGHGTIGLVATLAHLGHIGSGFHRIETPVGTVSAQLHSDGSVSVQNVPAYRWAHQVAVDVEGAGILHGDIAWGGNWFFLVDQKEHKADLSLAHVNALTGLTERIRQALGAQGITGAEGAEIDHIELFGPPEAVGAQSKNFVLCPGSAYDRSPCGTGTSAKLACLLEDGKIVEGETWRQESIIGSMFDGSIVRHGDDLIPTITGRAFVNAEATLLLDDADPFCWGIRSTGNAS